MYTKHFPGAVLLTALLLAFTACHKELHVPPAEAATGKLSLRLDGLDIQKTDPNGRGAAVPAAVDSAPAGWRLPSAPEWKILEDYLKQNNLTGLETNGFHGVLAGMYSVIDNRLSSFREYAYYKSTSGNVFPCYTTCGSIYSMGYSCESFASSIRYIKN